MSHTYHPRSSPRVVSLGLASAIVMALILVSGDQWDDAFVYLGEVLALAGLSYGFWMSITNWDLAYPEDKDPPPHG